MDTLSPSVVTMLYVISPSIVTDEKLVATFKPIMCVFGVVILTSSKYVPGCTRIAVASLPVAALKALDIVLNGKFIDPLFVLPS